MAAFVNTHFIHNGFYHLDLTLLEKILSEELYIKTQFPTLNSLLRILDATSSSFPCKEIEFHML